ncbi:hypothetical protein [Sphingobacterium thalpophilum]|uniref:hypothetical protein n=1 Tax=Sphingobacterium thalpophilum TaxID=259 RepID=UPI003D951774
MGLFSNNRKGKGSHPFFHKTSKTVVGSGPGKGNVEEIRTHSTLLVKQYDILHILKEILMPQNQN